jgi:hypothetical protein
MKDVKIHSQRSIAADLGLLGCDTEMKVLRSFEILRTTLPVTGTRGGAVVEALRYKPEGHGFDSRWYHWIVS